MQGSAGTGTAGRAFSSSTVAGTGDGSSTPCYLARFTDTPCDFYPRGAPDPAHLIARQRLRIAGLGELAEDLRSWVPACRAHHHALDVARTIRLDLGDYPADFLEFADEHGFLFAGPERGWLIPVRATS